MPICTADAQRALDAMGSQYGYRFSNLAPPEEGNTDSIFFLAAFSGGETRASALAFGALRELARQRILWEVEGKAPAG